MTKCKLCNDTGVNETGNNDLPCTCPAGDRALFNTCGVKGPVTGAELRRHFHNGAPEPIKLGREPILAENLPGRLSTKRTLLQMVMDGSSEDDPVDLAVRRMNKLVEKREFLSLTLDILKELDDALQAADIQCHSGGTRLYDAAQNARALLKKVKHE